MAKPAARMAINNQRGAASSTVHASRPPRYRFMMSTKASPMMKSSPVASTAPKIGASRAKYTFFTSVPSNTSICAPIETAVWRNIHGTSTDRAYAAYEWFPFDNSANRPKMTVKMPRKASGWIIAHATPRVACLYFSRTLRSAKAQTTSRKNQTSRKPSRTPGGRFPLITSSFMSLDAFHHVLPEHTNWFHNTYYQFKAEFSGFMLALGD